MAPAAAPQPRSQRQRREATREALLDATIACLVQQGYAQLTTTTVAERARVSRGAQVHHFPTKAALVSAAVEHLTVRQAGALLQAAGNLPPGGEDRTRHALDLLWGAVTGDLAAAGLELWVAARTDTELRERLLVAEAALMGDVRIFCRRLFAAAGEQPGFDGALDAALEVMAGVVLLAAVDDRPAERRWPALREGLIQLFTYHPDDDVPRTGGRT